MKPISYQPNGKEQVAEKLEALLADLQVYEKNIHRLMWAKPLRPYFDLGEKVDRLYHITHENTLRIGEQLLAMGRAPEPGEQIPPALIKPQVHSVAAVRQYDDAISTILNGSRQLLKTVRTTFFTAAHYEEKQTMEMMARLAFKLSFAIRVFTHERMAHMN